MEDRVITCMRYCWCYYFSFNTSSDGSFIYFFSFEGTNIALQILQVTINEVQFREASKKLEALLADPDVEVSTIIKYQPSNYYFLFYA